MAWNSFLNPIMRPLLQLPSFWAIFIISTLITLAITLVYKYATDQKHMKHLKGKVKEFQERMKKLRDQPDKMMKVQQEAMKYNMELMKHSFKPTLYTMIPLLLIFGWLNAHMAFHPLSPGEEFTLTAAFADGVAGNASLNVIPNETIVLLSNASAPIVEGAAVWTLQGEAGTYKATIDAGGERVEQQFIISDLAGEYAPPVQKYKGTVTKLSLSNEVVKPLGSISLFGWHPGWLGTYILLSIILSTLLRKALGVV